MRSEAWHPPDPTRLARMGGIATVLVLPVLVLDAAWHDVALTAGLVGALAVIALSAALIVTVVALQRRRSVSDGIATSTFYVWNALAMTALTAFVVAVGGDPRRYGILYGLVMGLGAALFPARGQLILQPVAIGSYAVVLLASDLAPSEVGVQLALVATVSWMLIEGAIRARSSWLAEQEARTAADRQAGLASALTRLTTLDPDELMDRIADAVVGLGFELATIAVLRDGYLVPARHRGFAPGAEPYGIPADRGLAGRAMSERRTITVGDYLDFEGRLPGRDGVRATVAVPLTHGDDVVGALIGSRSAPGGPDPREVEALEVLATHAGHALVNARRFESEQRAVARLTELEVMKSDFVSNVSHELRTPLTVIHGVGETLAAHGEALGDDRRRDLLARLNANSARLSAMISTLLDFSRFESGNAEISPAPVPLRHVLEGLIARLAPLLEHHEVTTDVADEAVIVDPRLFEHVVENLLSNALRHTPPGTRVCLRAVPEGGVARISVRDEGPGIATEDLARITERFYRGGPAGTRPAGGVGLGLALCEQILAAHGTSLTVRSEEGVGTEFSFVLPLAVPAPVRGAGSGVV
ncbi:MAG: GAF domain-containing protein [Actinobacteria bacterium]|nr:GAF domain-containing protein [Actinomycetota bacterium]